MNPRLQPLHETVTAHRDRFERFCRSLSREELQRPVPESHWIVKDYISHLATIDRTVTEWFRTLADGAPTPENAGAAAGEGERGGFDIDAWNERQVQRRRNASVDELLAEAAERRGALLAIMDRFTDATLAADIHFPGDANRKAERINFGGYLIAWARHDPAHTADMLRALPERAEQPQLRAWLRDTRAGGWPPTERL